MKPKAFVLYPNQWEPLSCLSDEQLGRLFRHLFTWLNDGSLDLQKEEQLVESDILLAFRFMRMQINIDIKNISSCAKKERKLPTNDGKTTQKMQMHILQCIKKKMKMK